MQARTDTKPHDDATQKHDIILTRHELLQHRVSSSAGVGVLGKLIFKHSSSHTTPYAFNSSNDLTPARSIHQVPELSPFVSMSATMSPVGQ